jgi:molecular chaperone GrpE (heat shock protein)
MNSETRSHGLPFWPFIILDILFLGIAGVLYKYTHRPFETVDSALIIVCIAGAAFCFALPFLRRNADENAQVQTQTVADAVKEIRKLDQVAQQIGIATSQWQGVQEHATKTVDAAREVADSMAAEAKSFVEFLKKANESEKAHLRVEVDKLRRAEGEWLQATVRIMDNVFALNQAALQSGQPNLVKQISQFNNQCCEPARRLGLVPTTAIVGDAYDQKQHDLYEGEVAGEKSFVAGTVACGYTYQGEVIRKPMVLLEGSKNLPAQSSQ